MEEWRMLSSVQARVVNAIMFRAQLRAGGEACAGVCSPTAPERPGLQGKCPRPRPAFNATIIIGASSQKPEN
ncbi:hypothetical protein O181_036028 [Austropuccinia psidii MF-1]|uniref:Uncharacterized protein n=1 Tax=Austropuccinia psidii MF-1 TaxID=1389203 RepID=A0A9Q3H8T5_9BASI|nr:hypothetical protein [Austropuccinia psidii MF-1]